MARVSVPPYTTLPAGRLRPGLVAAGAGIVVGLAAALLPSEFLPLLAVALLIAALLRAPALGVGLLIATRSSLDRFGEQRIIPPPLSLNLAAVLGILLILVGAVVLTERMRRRASLDWGGRFTWIWAGWIAVSAAGVLIGVLQHGRGVLAPGIKELVRLTSLLSLYLLVVNLSRTPKMRSVMLWCVLLGVLVPAGIGYYELLTGQVVHAVHTVGRVAGSFVHPNPFAVWMAAILMLCVGLWSERMPGLPPRWALGVVFVLGGILLVFSFSRSGWALLLLAILWWAWRGDRRRRLTVLVGLAVASLAFAGVVRWRFEDLTGGRQVVVASGEPEGNSVEWRLRNYALLLMTFRDSPLVGHGTKTVSLVNPQKTLSVEGYVSGSESHNEVIRVLVEHGLIGLMLYAAFVILLLRFIARTAREQLPPERGGYTGLAGVMLPFTGSLVVGGALGMEILSQTALWYVLCTLLGVMYAARA